MLDQVNRMRQRIHHHYISSVELTPASYYGGARIQALPPLDAVVGTVMVIGAYPSARFETIGRERDVPVGDNLGPFEPQRYFDGTRVRTVNSSDELQASLLGPLCLARSDCWVTDLVKVFLFKKGHRDKYARLGSEAPAGYEREQFEDLAAASLSWVADEAAVACPELIITLGAEVAGVLRGVRGNRDRTQLLGAPPSAITLGRDTYQVVHLAHPGILMRGEQAGRNPWPARHQQHLEMVRELLKAR